MLHIKNGYKILLNRSLNTIVHYAVSVLVDSPQ